MKKILIIFLILTLTISMASCFNQGNQPDDDQQGTGEPDQNQPGNDPDQNDPDDNKPGTDNAESSSEKIINVYLIAGQSNAVGYGMDTGNRIAYSDTRYVDGFENVLYYGDQERWNGEALDKEFKPVKLGMGVASDRSGAEIGIASAIADNGEMNAIIKCAQGATHLYPDTQYDVSLNYGTWTSPSYLAKHNIDTSKNPKIGYMYTRFENTVIEGLELLIAEGYTPVIKGVWWMQGEAEMFTLPMASAYREMFEMLISDTRNMLSKISGYDCSSVPFVCGLPKWNTNNSPAPAYQGMVRTAMTTVASEMENVDFVDCMPLTQHDDWHFDAAGQKHLGRSFVAKLEDFESETDTGFTEMVSIDGAIKLLPDEKGLEFKANLLSFDSRNEYTYGFIILPTASLVENNITSDYISSLDELGVEYTNVVSELHMEKVGDDYYDLYYTAKLSGIAYENLNTSYTAVAYIKNSYGGYYYSSAFVSDSIARLASEELYKDDADIDAIIKIVNAGINFVSGKSEESAENDPDLEFIAEDISLVYSQTSVSHKLQFEKSVDVDYFVKYTSENPDIVSVDKNGVITAHSQGSTFILIECAGKTKKVGVTVECFSVDGVTFDGIISHGEYLGQTIHNSNGTLDVAFTGMIKNGNLYMSYTLTHGEWSPLSSNWWLNDNIEFKLNDGVSHTVVFYEGVPTFSGNIKYGMSHTEKINGKYVTTVELCVEGVSNAQRIKVGFNGVNFGWLGAIWNNELNLAYVTVDGIISEAPINLGNGIVLDGILDEDIYTDDVKANSITANGNGADVEIMGTLTEGGVVFGVIVNHEKATTETTIPNGDWFTFMNIEFHFGGSGTQFIAIAHNRNSLGQLYTYCNTVPSGNGYISTFEIFIPYEAIGVGADAQSLDFTARGWFETGWCDLLNTSWDATHRVTNNGIYKNNG